MKDIRISYEIVKMPKKIVVDGVNYPTHTRNLKVIAKYEETKDESVLDNLVIFSLDFGDKL